MHSQNACRISKNRNFFVFIHAPIKELARISISWLQRTDTRQWKLDVFQFCVFGAVNDFILQNLEDVLAIYKYYNNKKIWMCVCMYAFWQCFTKMLSFLSIFTLFFWDYFSLVSVEKTHFSIAFYCCKREGERERMKEWENENKEKTPNEQWTA